MSPAPTSPTPTVTFVIPCYNARPYLAECLQSIERVADADWEVVVVDDGSTQSIRDIVDQFAPLARYVWQANQGPAAARNHGVRVSSGRFIRFLDADDYLIGAEPLRAQLSMMESSPEVGFVHAAATKIDQQGRPIGTRRAPQGLRNQLRPGADVFAELLMTNYITTSTALVRRDIFDCVGGFRVDLFGPEDWDCWLRITRICSVGYVAAPAVAYRVHPTSITARYKDRIDSWLRMHTDILDRQFADVRVARDFGRVRRAAYSTMYGRAARLARRAGRRDLARVYARTALPAMIATGKWRFAARCMWFIATGWPQAHHPVRV